MAWNSTLTPHQRLPHHRGMDRRRFLLTSLAGAVQSLVAPMQSARTPGAVVARSGGVAAEA
jgi:hypothetical protein